MPSTSASRSCSWRPDPRRECGCGGRTSSPSVRGWDLYVKGCLLSLFGVIPVRDLNAADLHGGFRLWRWKSANLRPKAVYKINKCIHQLSATHYHHNYKWSLLLSLLSLLLLIVVVLLLSIS